MNGEQFWSRVFRIKGIYNCITSVLVGLSLPLALDWLGLPPMGDLLYFHLFLSLAFVFGIGYLRVGLQISQTDSCSREVIILGVLGQTSVFILSWIHSAGQPLPIAMFQIGAGIIDIIFAVLFLAYLWRPCKDG